MKCIIAQRPSCNLFVRLFCGLTSNSIVFSHETMPSFPGKHFAFYYFEERNIRDMFSFCNQFPCNAKRDMERIVKTCVLDHMRQMLKR